MAIGKVLATALTDENLPLTMATPPPMSQSDYLMLSRFSVASDAGGSLDRNE